MIKFLVDSAKGINTSKINKEVQPMTKSKTQVEKTDVVEDVVVAPEADAVVEEVTEEVAGNLEQNASGSGNGPSCRTAQIIPLGNSTLYVVGTSVGLFATSNLDGENTVWEMIAKDVIGNVIIEQIDYRHSDGRFTIATYGSGIYQYSNLQQLGDVLTVNDVNMTPKSEKLQKHKYNN